jgi:cysteine-rich repeat protein
VNLGEFCDDGNLIDGDGCDSNCTATSCGNGVQSTGEGCDDGNLTDGDNCDSNCTPTACGNDVLTTGEVCDDGNLIDGDGCDSNCTDSACGNDVTAPNESCDDGNLVDDDGCDSNCTVSGCGNDILNVDELCDDGNLTDDDGCDSNCKPTACGNDVVTSGEQCDDGNTENEDGCDGLCQREAGCTPNCPDFIFVAGSTYSMGSLVCISTNNPIGCSNVPRRNEADSFGNPHDVAINDFYISRTEVTVGQYRACVDAGECTQPATVAADPDCTYDSADGEGKALNCVTWEQSVTFATWVNARLPTEAEWEYAAKSGGQDSVYPWGNSTASCERAIMKSDTGISGCGTQKVADTCTRPLGNTAQGACDMIGNVWEWVQDDYHDNYDDAPVDGTAWNENPSTGQKVYRGGGWFFTQTYMTSTRRLRFDQSSHRDFIGFRLARSVTE